MPFDPTQPFEEVTAAGGTATLDRSKPFEEVSHFDTLLNPKEEGDFAKWKQTYAPKDSGDDYDLRGAFKAGLKPDPETGHWPDTYKKPNHPTFSDQSIYAKDAPDKAGHWEGETFVPPSSVPGPDWAALTSGLDEAHSRMTPDQHAAFFQLANTDPSKDSQKAAISQAYIQSRLPHIDAATIQQNWPAVREAFATHGLGMTEAKGIDDGRLYDAIHQNETAKQVHLSKEFQDADMHGRIELLGKSMLAHLGEPLDGVKWSLGNAWEKGNTPFKALPTAAEAVNKIAGTNLPDNQPLPDIPGLGMSNPALVGTVYGMVKPMVEGIESPIGAATLGTLPVLKAGGAAAKSAYYGIVGLFTGLMAKSSVEGIIAKQSELKGKSTMEQAQILAPEIGAGGLAIFGGLHTAMDLMPPGEGVKLASDLQGRTPGEAANILRTAADDPALGPPTDVAPSAIQPNLAPLDAVTLGEGESVKMVGGKPVVTPAVGQTAGETPAVYVGEHPLRTALNQVADHLDSITPEGVEAHGENVAAKVDNGPQITETDSGFVVTDASGKHLDTVATIEEARRVVYSVSSPEKVAAIKQAVATPGVQWQYTVQRPMVPGGKGFIQVDAVKDGENLISSNLEDLRAYGADLSDVPDSLPQGQYTLEQIKEAAKQPEKLAETATSEATKADEAISGPANAESTPVTAASIISLAREIDPQLLASKIKEAKAFIASEEEKGIPLSPRMQADQVTLAARSVLETRHQDARAFNMLDADAGIDRGAASDQTTYASPHHVFPEVGQQTKLPGEPLAGIKNAAIDAELRRMGLPEATHGEKLEFKEGLADAAAKIEKDPTAGDKLVKELEAKIRPVDGKETSLLIYEVNRLSLERDAAAREVEEARASGDAPRLEEARAHEASVIDDYQRAADVFTKVGTVGAQGQAFRQIMLKRDYSLANLERQEKATRGVEKLTDEQSSELSDLQKRYAETQKAFDDYVAQHKAKSARAATPNKPAEGNRLSKMAESARSRIAARLEKSMGAQFVEGEKTEGFLSKENINDFAIIGADYIAKGAVKLGEWSEAMIKEFGEQIKPHLQAIFEKANAPMTDILQEAAMQRRKAAIESSIKRLTEKIESGDISPEAAEARRPAVEEIEKLEQQRDALKDELGAMRKTSAKISDLQKAISEKEAKIEAGDLATKGQAANRPSPEAIEKLKQDRDALNDQLAEARKEAGKPSDGEVIQKKVDALKEQIAERRKVLKSGDVTAKKAINRPMVEEVEKAKQELEQVNKEISDSRKGPAKTPEQIRLTMLDQRIKEVERQISEGEVFPKGDKTKPDSAAIRDRQEKLDALKEQRQYLRESLQPKPEPPTKEQARLASFKKRRVQGIEKGKEKLASGDVGPAPKPEPLHLDKEAMRLKAEHEAVKREINQRFELNKENAKPGWQKALDRASGLARASALSGYHTLAKLATYSLAKFAEIPATEALGALIRQLPGMKEISAKANLEAGQEATGLARFYMKAATDGAQDAWETLKSGQSNLKIEVGNAKENHRPIHWYDYFGISHAAEKAPLFRGAFEMALEKNTAHAIENGVDVSDDMVQAGLRKEAGDYANRAILQENNMFSEWLNSLTNRMEAENPKTGKVAVEKAVLSAFIKTFLTKGIVKTPSNYIMQTLDRTPLGLARGVGGAVIAHARGIESLTPEEANTISRLLKVGAVGSAMFAWGAIDATKKKEDRIFGGYYQPGDKRNADDVGFGHIRIEGVEIPHLFTHNPLTESAQMGSTMMRVMSSRLRKGDPEEKGALAGATASILALASQAPIVNPVTRTAQSVERGQADRVIWDMLAGLVPQLVQNIATDTDSQKRQQPKNLGQALELTTPGLRQNVPAKP